MASSRLRVPCLLLLAVGLSVLIPACGEEEVPAPTTPTPAPAPPPAPPPEPAPEPPAVPAELRISASGADFIEWAWNPVPDVSGYDVQYSTNEAFTDEDEVIARTVEQSSYRRTGLTAETSGYLRVRSAAGTGDDRITSDWSTHVTGMTMAAAPAVPATPTNVRVTGRTDTTITWSWNAVEGAAGYQVQHSDSATLADDAPTAFASTTTHTVSRLASRTDHYLRVRAYSGTISEPVFGGWSATVEGTTDRPPAPVTTALSAPTGLSAGSQTNSSITVRWSAVDDVEEYEVQVQPAGGSWTGASCGGGDARVTVEVCVASDLDRGTSYQFRVRAHPDPDDETREASGWSSTTAAQTSGPAQREEVTGGDDELNITWESDDESITWSWDPPSDNRIRYLIALVRPAANERSACPALISASDATAFADPTSAGTNTGWFGGEDGLAQFSQKVTFTDGEGVVRRLCVVRTWKDANDTPQYGEVSSAWAATAPKSGSAPAGDGRIQDGPTVDSNRRTTALDWYVELDQGFEYEIQTVSATVGDGLPDCGSGSGNTELDSATDDNSTRFRYKPTTSQTYTTFAACARASNGQGVSGWTKVTGDDTSDDGEYSTLPAAPATATYTGTKTFTGEIAAASVSELTWRFSEGTRLPEDPGGYTAKILVWIKANTAGTSVAPAVRPNQTKCESPPTDEYTEVAAEASVADEGGSFSITPTGAAIARVGTGTSDQTRTFYACVRAELPDGTNAGTSTSIALEGPWSVGTGTVIQKPSE